MLNCVIAISKLNLQQANTNFLYYKLSIMETVFISFDVWNLNKMYKVAIILTIQHQKNQVSSYQHNFNIQNLKCKYLTS